MGVRTQGRSAGTRRKQRVSVGACLALPPPRPPSLPPAPPLLHPCDTYRWCCRMPRSRSWTWWYSWMTLRSRPPRRRRSSVPQSPCCTACRRVPRRARREWWLLDGGGGSVPACRRKQTRDPRVRPNLRRATGLWTASCRGRMWRNGKTWKCRWAGWGWGRRVGGWGRRQAATTAAVLVPSAQPAFCPPRRAAA